MYSESYVTISSERLEAACKLAIAEAKVVIDARKAKDEENKKFKNSLAGWDWFRFNILETLKLPHPHYDYGDKGFRSYYKAVRRDEIASQLLRMASKGNKQVMVCYSDYSWIYQFLESGENG